MEDDEEEDLDSKPLLLKFGVAVAVSFVGFLCYRFRTLNPNSVSDDRGEVDSGETDRSKDDFRAVKMSITSDPQEMSKQRMDDSTSISHDEDVFFLTQFDDLVKEFDFSAVIEPSPNLEVEAPRLDLDTSITLTSAKKDDYEQEIEHLRNTVKLLQEKEKNLEARLLEYYGLKEQETAVTELVNRLKIKNTEVKLFSLKIESLQLEKRRLQSQVTDHEKAVAELESARSRIKMLKKKLKHEAEMNKEQILNLQKRVARLQEQELEAPVSNPDIESKLQRLKVLECEVEELRNLNTRLQMENSELARKLESTQILANSVLEDPERKAMDETSNRLRQENEDLTKQIEQLQLHRCADVEELVYLRWINACLRYELRNYRSPTGETVARDLSRSLSPKSEAKAKKLILEYAHTEGMDSIDFDCDQWSSSQASETQELDDPLIENSSATKPTNSGKTKFFKNLRRLIRRKDGHHPNHASSMGKPDHVDDPPTWSSSTMSDSVTMVSSRSDRVTTPSQSSSGTSSDIPRWRSFNDEHIKNIKKFRSKSGSYGYRSFVVGKDGDDDLNFPLKPKLETDSDSFWKSELVKFGEVLEGARKVKIHKKSASIV
ncbi:Protein CHUP1, chloroplastic -like protein [Gossypium arboreum]|uniref:Protein CHUP1, chloroplastic-like protein n=1 Tax=Gossypium arboreum TaxID=29729 RepID=A0A0B0PVU0_GOSAR|nr:protein CHUP1, chloroplastic-like [Gossypium arboreum]XP_017612160.1 protein CHUP1, chloroplastic-like [Gossypium arboreum]XP_052885443.1 protein CHUP1, chloroplastic-like [Gossypium arboreum]XP_052885444.1 protein CHUP1, chloroplastic-like [Gossypium arboreum]KHG28937.1 Protein CHUP1, chloroplastic -like protein [Gossypium arboreum]